MSQAHREAAMVGVLLCRLACGALKRHWVQSCGSTHQVFDGLNLSIVQLLNVGVGGEKGYSDGSIPYGGLSGITLLLWLPNLLPYIPSVSLS